LAAIPRFYFAWADQGIFWPDETYQSLEPAHQLVFGYGLMPWEFREGARSWLFPAIFAAFWKVLSLFGVSRSQTLVPLAKCLMVIVALVGIWAGMRLAEKWTGSNGALLAGALLASFPASVVYGSRCMTEMASGPLLLLAVWLLVDVDVDANAAAASKSRSRRVIAAGVLAGLTVFLRYQNGLVLVGLLAMLFAWKRKDDAIRFGAAALVIGLAGGVLDWVTWGQPFKSFLVYIDFNLIQGKASGWGTAAFTYYFETLWTSSGPIILLLVVAGFGFFAREQRALTAICVAYLLAHSLVPHKELRFLMPIVPLMLTLSAAGLVRISDRLKQGSMPVWVVSAVFVVVGMRTALGETFAQMGQYNEPAQRGLGATSPWHSNEGANLALWDASDRSDLCGITVVGVAPAWQAGYTYLHRPVPLFYRFSQGEAAASNYVVAPAGSNVGQLGYNRLGTFGSFALFRRDGPCAPAPYATNLLP
jgi:hypothetical protein